jgi:hypothetical protein
LSRHRVATGPISPADLGKVSTPSYQVILQENQPANEDIELAWCEFTDDHGFTFLRYVKQLRFHHNLVENFSDVGLE